MPKYDKPAKDFHARIYIVRASNKRSARLEIMDESTNIWELVWIGKGALKRSARGLVGDIPAGNVSGPLPPAFANAAAAAKLRAGPLKVKGEIR